MIGFTMDGIPHTPGQQPGVELRRLRQARGWSLAEMARQVPYSKSYLSKLETGTKRITLDIARCVDEAMGTDGALAAVVCAIDGGALPADDEPVGSEACPYPGLAAFGPDQARWFFGRGDTTRDLISQLDNPLTRGELVAVVAASGAGKSSVLAAGLIPNLARGALPGSWTWPVVLTTPGEHPLATLAAKVATATNTDPAGVTGDPDRFAAFLADAVTTHSGELGTTPHHARIVLIVDQFEETFTECHQEAERQQFIATLDAVAASAAALVVLGVRADFYGRCLSYPALHTALQRPVTLGPMSVDQLRAVITCPAEAEGLNLEPGLVELMLRDLGVADDMGGGPAGYDPGTLPLLAHALRATWRQRDGRTLTVAAYRRTGGISQALATTAEDTHAGLGTAEQHIARQLLLRLVNVSEHGGSGDTRRRLSRAELIEALPPQQSTQVVEKVLEAFGRARLITFDTTNVEITHEALIRAWPRLRAWIDTGRASNVIRQELEQAAAVWDRDRRDTAGLYRGSRLEAASTWASSTTHEDDLSPTASAFLAASTRHEHSAATLRRAVLVVLSVFALVASGAAAVAFYQSAAAQQERDTAIFNQITAQADRLRSTDVSLAAQLDLTAYRMRPTSQNLYTALITDADAALSTPLEGHQNAVRAVAFSGRILASGSDDGTVRLWNVADPTHPTPVGPPLAGYPGTVLTLAFSPDGRFLADGGDDGTVRLWNVADPTHPTPVGPPLAGYPGTVLTLAFSPDGRTLADGGDDHPIRLWNVADPTHPRPLGPPLIGHARDVNAVVFRPDGRILASSSDDHTIRLWNVADPAHPTPVGPPLSGSNHHINTVAFSPDGRTLASGGNDQAVRLWNVTDPTHPTALGLPLTDHTNYVNAVAFSPDGRTLAVGSDDQKVRLWNVTDPTHPIALGPPLAGHGSYVNALAFSPDGRTLATAGSDDTVRLWNIPATLMTGHTNSVFSVAFNHHDHTLATGSADGTVRLWNVSDPTHPRPLGQLLPSPPHRVRAVVFSPDGHILASGGDDPMVRLWNVSDPTHPISLGQLPPGHTKPVNTVAFSPDGHTLATGSRDHTVRLWNVTDPTHPTSLSQLLSDHADSINAVAFSPDGHTLATASRDQTIRLWDVTDPAHPLPLGKPLTGHTGFVDAVAFSPDGYTLASGGRDHTVRLWEMNVDQAIQRICTTTRNTLTADTWKFNGSPNVPYSPPCP
ncbi:MAG: helix-turn-helix domain-containing protein [Pseudonocardiaceae bacterium]